MKAGLTMHEWKQFNEILVKANREQLSYIETMVEKNIKNRNKIVGGIK